MRSFLLFLFLAFLILGPRWGFFDTSVFVPIALAPMLVRRPMCMKYGFVVFALSVLGLICYQLVVLVGAPEFPFETIGRLIRVVVSTILVGLVVSGDSVRPRHWWIKVFVWVTILHSVLVLLGGALPAANSALAVMIDAERVRDYRSSGLLGGFDVAGVLTLFGLLTVIFFRKIFSPKLVVYFFVPIFFAASAFESRVTMVVALLVVSMFLLNFIFNHHISLALKIPSVLAAGGMVLFAGSYVLVVILTTFGMDVTSSRWAAGDVVYRYATYDWDSGAVTSMFFLPPTISGVFFGTGFEPGNSDVGYVREIFRYGVIGLMWALFSHFIFILGGDYASHGMAFRRRAISLLFCVVSLMLVLSFKNNYIFVRNIFPAFLVLVAALGYSGSGGRRAGV